MIEIFLRRLMQEKGSREGRKVSLTEVSEAVGISRQALTKIADFPGANVETGSLDKLCTYFGCRIEQLIEYRPGTETAKPSQSGRKTVPAAAKKKPTAAKKPSK